MKKNGALERRRSGRNLFRPGAARHLGASESQLIAAELYHLSLEVAQLIPAEIAQGDRGWPNFDEGWRKHPSVGVVRAHQFGSSRDRSLSQKSYCLSVR